VRNGESREKEGFSGGGICSRLRAESSVHDETEDSEGEILS